MIRSILTSVALLLLLTACANHSTLLLPAAGTWTSDTVLLGPVVACRGGNLDFSEHHKECNQWPLSLPSMPHPEIHHAELRTKAAQQYQIDVGQIVLKDVQVIYNTELVGTIRGWKATAIAGKNPLLMK
jgi:hypothetical protein